MASAGILFTGTSAQKLIVTDVAVEGRCLRSSPTTTSPSEPAQTRYYSPTAACVRRHCLRRQSAKSRFHRVQSRRSLESPRRGRNHFPVVVQLGPDVAQSQVCTLSLTDCNIEGFLQIDSS